MKLMNFSPRVFAFATSIFPPVFGTFCRSFLSLLMIAPGTDATTTGRCITWAYPQAGETRYGGNGGGFYVQALK